MKKFFVCIYVIVSLLSIGFVYGAEANVRINGNIINFEDTNAQIINDRTMVPFRRIFNEFGVIDDNIDWDGETKTIIAKKDETEIKLQIGNNIAEKKVNNNTTKITLDSVPIIINGRTLVPLRFIAESLGKNVSWDPDSKTAIINDEGYIYTNMNTASNVNTNAINDDYYMNAIKNKSESLYNFLNTQSSNMKVNITRNYTDLENTTNNNTAVVNVTVSETQNVSSIHQDVTVTFSGSNDLMKDIASEGWANIHYENDYFDTYFTTRALTDGLKKVYGQEQLKFLYTGLNCNGKNTYTISDLLKEIANEQSTKSGRDEFDALFKILKPNETGGLTTGNISSETIEMNNFDLTKLDNTMYNSPFNRVWCFLNSQIFNYDVTWEELRYDYPNMNLNINVNNLELMIDFILSNDYNEKVEYLIKINK